MAGQINLFLKQKNNKVVYRMVNRKESLDLLKKLISIKSNYFHEKEIMEYCYDWFRNNDMNISYHHYIDDKVTNFNGINIIGEIKGTEEGPVLLINGHLDTVEECTGWSKNPYVPEEKDGKLYGLGALDMKSGCVAAMMALREFKRNVKNFKGKIIYSFVSDEEGPYGLGTNFLLNDGLMAESDIALVTEPSSGFLHMKTPVICLGARGGYGYSIKVYGKSSHAATPENGINAVDEAGKLLVELSKTVPVYDEKLGYSSHCVIEVKGGGAACSVPDNAEIKVFRHIVRGESKATIIKEIDEAAKKCELKGEYEIVFREAPLENADGFMPYVVDENLLEIDLLKDSIKKATSKEAEIKYFSSIGDFNSIASKLNIPVIIYGASGDNFHGSDEAVDIESFYETIEVIYDFLVKYLAV